MSKFSYYGQKGDVRRLRHFQGTEFTVLEGVGEDGDPFREITYFFDDDGRLIVRRDPSEQADPREATR